MKIIRFLASWAILFTMCGCSVIYKPPYDIQLSYNHIDFKPAAFYTIPLSGKDKPKVKWYSSNPEIVKIVNSKGKVNAISNGQAIVSARIGRTSWDITVNVKNQKNFVVCYQDDQQTVCSAEAPDTVSLGSFSIVLNKSQYTFSGKTVKPEAVVEDNDKHTLKEGVDYRLEYKNNNKVGTATVNAIGINNYSGIIEKSFKIVDNNTNSSSNSTLSIDDAPVVIQTESAAITKKNQIDRGQTNNRKKSSQQARTPSKQGKQESKSKEKSSQKSDVSEHVYPKMDTHKQETNQVNNQNNHTNQTSDTSNSSMNKSGTNSNAGSAKNKESFSKTGESGTEDDGVAHAGNVE